MLVIPFANALGPRSGPATDGVIYGVLPQVAASSVLRVSHLAGLSRVLRGNADATGAVTFTDVSVAAGNDTPNDVSLFDTANPTADRLCIALAAADRINGIKFLISTAAVLTGTPVAQVRYKTASGWQSATGVVTPLLTATGLVSVSFNEVNAADIVLIDDLIDPISNPQMRCLFLQFGGITGVTTPPAFTRAWKSLVHTNTMPGAILTTLLAQGANPDFSTQGALLPIVDDTLLFGFDEKPVRLLPTLYRAGDTAHAREWVYSQAGGLAALPAANISDPSVRLTFGDGRDYGNAVVDETTVPGQTILKYATVGSSGFTPPSGVTSVRALVLAGGGGGGGGENVVAGDGAGGGGAGEFIHQATLPVTPGAALIVTVGQGGAGQGVQAGVGTGGGTSGSPSSLGLVIALGGGGGGANDANGLAGGSGGGSGGECSSGALAGGAATTTIGIGFAGGADADDDCIERSGGGGGGAGGVGQNSSDVAVQRGGDGGPGVQNDITGASLSYAAGGGGGGGASTKAGGAGGSSIGGTGGTAGGAAATVGVASTGSGGGGGKSGSTSGGAGGSGVIVLRFATPVVPFHHIPVVPPSDWAKLSQVDVNNDAHNRYWLGLRTTADALAALLPENFTLRGQPMKGAGVQGIPAPETATYTKATVVARDVSPAASRLLLVNATTGVSAEVAVPANTPIAVATISLPVVKDDAVLLVQVIGHATVNLGDGAVYLS